MKKRFLPLLMLALVSFACEPSSEAETPAETQAPTPDEPQEPTYALNLNLVPDASWSVKEKRTEVTTLNPDAAAPAVSKVSTVITRKFNPQAVDKEQMLPINISYVGVYGEGSDGENKFLYDSNDPNTGPGNGLEHLLDTRLEVRLFPSTGQVVDIVGGKDMMERTTGQPDDAGRGDELFRQQLGAEFNFLPEDAVTIGDSWTRTGRFTSTYNVKYTSTYTLASVKGDRAVIDQATEITPIPTDELGEVLPVRYDLLGSASAKITLELSSGRVLQRESSSVMEGELVIEGGENQAVKIEIESYAESK